MTRTSENQNNLVFLLIICLTHLHICFPTVFGCIVYDCLFMWHQVGNIIFLGKKYNSAFPLVWLIEVCFLIWQFRKAFFSAYW